MFDQSKMNLLLSEISFFFWDFQKQVNSIFFYFYFFFEKELILFNCRFFLSKVYFNFFLNYSRNKSANANCVAINYLSIKVKSPVGWLKKLCISMDFNFITHSPSIIAGVVVLLILIALPLINRCSLFFLFFPHPFHVCYVYY